MGGLGPEIKCLVVGKWGGDIRVESGFPIMNDATIQEKLDHSPGVLAATPYAQGVVMLQCGRREH